MFMIYIFGAKSGMNSIVLLYHVECKGYYTKMTNVIMLMEGFYIPYLSFSKVSIKLI